MYFDALSECPPCYDLILDQVNIIRQKTKELQGIIGDVGRSGSLSEAEFRRQMTEVNDSLLKLLLDARRAVGKFTHIIGWRRAKRSLMA